MQTAGRCPWQQCPRGRSDGFWMPGGNCGFLKRARLLSNPEALSASHRLAFQLRPNQIRWRQPWQIRDQSQIKPAPPWAPTLTHSQVGPVLIHQHTHSLTPAAGQALAGVGTQPRAGGREFRKISQKRLCRG